MGQVPRLMIYLGDVKRIELDSDLVAEAWGRRVVREGVSRIHGTTDRMDVLPVESFRGQVAEIAFNVWAWQDIDRYMAKNIIDNERARATGKGDGGVDYGICDIKGHGKLPGRVLMFQRREDTPGGREERSFRSARRRGPHGLVMQAVVMEDEYKDHVIYVCAIMDFVMSKQAQVDRLIDSGMHCCLMGWVRGSDMIEKTAHNVSDTEYDIPGSFYRITNDLEPMSTLKREWFEEDESKW